ncbi:MAG TPA: hypothetical protein VMW27_05455 [Thermoanaerobaculia bacterium]|nr:hypothetical protein [Thermoanaerobaculia bacterium]
MSSRQHHVTLSGAQLLWLEFAERHPECLRRESFVALDEWDDFVKDPLQPWPLFISPAPLAELERVSVGLCRLVKSLPRRIFGNDPEGIADFYGLDADTALLIASVLEHGDDRLHGALARCDFIASASGLQCLELNVAGNLGGWETEAWLSRYRRSPLLARFLEESGLRFRTTDTTRLLFTHLTGQALCRGVTHEGGELNTAIVIHPEERPGPAWTETLDAVYREVLAGRGLAGRLGLCGETDLREKGGLLFLGGSRVHTVFDLYGGVLPRPVFAALMSGTVDVYNGPAARILSDKLNLALLSETAEDGPFTPEERQLIAAHVPWSRRVAEEFTDWHGERVYLPELLEAERERLVIKQGWAMQGADVCVGALTPPERWAGLTAAALERRDWVVQERVESVPYLLQAPEGGAVPHDVIWGLFVFGDVYGGCFLRMMPQGRTGVINRALGASQGMLFEVDE